MATKSKTQYTYADLERLPEDGVDTVLGSPDQKDDG